MRVTLIHNPVAGDEKHSAHQLIASVENAGHEVLYRSSKEEFEDALQQPADLAVVAGGDGTIAKVARRLLGSPLPMTIFPLGTANNIASCLGIVGEPAELLTRWDAARTIRYRPGWFTSGGKRRPFFEGLGAGLLVEAIHTARQSMPVLNEGGDEELQRHRQQLAEIARTCAAEEWTIAADGEELRDKYLFIAIMRIAAIGPRVPFAPAATADSERLALVTIGEHDRDLLVDFLTAHKAGSDRLPALPVRESREITLHHSGGQFHADDKVRTIDGDSIEVTTGEESVRIVIPSGATS